MKAETRLLKLQQSAVRAKQSLSLLKKQLPFYTCFPGKAEKILELYECYLQGLQQEIQKFLP